MKITLASIKVNIWIQTTVESVHPALLILNLEPKSV
jgi:hypothetical protein